LVWGELVGEAGLERLVGAGAAHDGFALAIVELVVVAGEGDGGLEGVAAREEPGDVVGGGLEGGVVNGCEEGVVFGVRAAMGAFVGHRLVKWLNG
jgi:hypothetical protein